MGPYRRLTATYLLLLASACGGDTPRSHAVVSDSAGITIVTSPDSSLRYATIADSPVVRLAEQGVPSREFFRVTDAFVYSDGAAVVANAGSREIRLFDSAGADMISIGGDGDGPGEFRSVGRLFPLEGDSLAAPDSRLLRVSVFDRHGTFARTVSFMPTAALAPPESTCIRPELKAVLANGAQVYIGWTCMRRDPGGGFQPFEADLILWEPRSESMTVMDRVPVLEAYAPPGGDRSNVDVAFPPFMKITAITARGASAYVTTGAGYEVRKYVRGGGSQALFRLQRPARATAGEPRDAYIRTLPEGSEAPSPFPETLPAFDRLMVDDGQRVWAREYPAPGILEEHWAVFEADGQFAGWVNAPAGVTLRAVGGSHAIGVATDDLGVERPLILQLARER